MYVCASQHDAYTNTVSRELVPRGAPLFISARPSIRNKVGRLLLVHISGSYVMFKILPTPTVHSVPEEYLGDTPGRTTGLRPLFRNKTIHTALAVQMTCFVWREDSTLVSTLQFVPSPTEFGRVIVVSTFGTGRSNGVTSSEKSQQNLIENLVRTGYFSTRFGTSARWHSRRAARGRAVRLLRDKDAAWEEALPVAYLSSVQPYVIWGIHSFTESQKHFRRSVRFRLDRTNHGSGTIIVPFPRPI
jgi:hypothetical protein